MDRAWWRKHLADVRRSFRGVLVSCTRQAGEVRHVVFDYGENSGAGAIGLAVHAGAQRILLLGYDCQRTGGRSHWHGDHPAGLDNAGVVDAWPAQFAAFARGLASTVAITNCTRESALTCFPRASLQEALACPS